MGENVNVKLGKLYKELFNLYNSGELDNINSSEGVVLRDLLVNMCENIGCEYSEMVNLNIFEKSKLNDEVYKKYING